ncbi:hypothetical protein GCM10028778_04480 [Barrientosiimonas marina]
MIVLILTYYKRGYTMLKTIAIDVSDSVFENEMPAAFMNITKEDLDNT